MANVFDKYNFGTQSNNYNNRQRKQEETGYLDALMRGGKANLQGVAGGLGYLFGAEQFANDMQRNAQENARKREHDTVFSLDYITDPEGLAYDVGGNLGSMVALAPFAMAVPAGVATAGAGAIGAGLGRLGLSKGAQWALGEAGKKALATGIRGAGAGVGESLAEWGSTAQEAQAKGAENPRLDTMGVFGQNLLVNPVSSGLEYMLLGGKLFNPTAKAGETFATRAVKAPMRALPAGGANAIQNGIEEVTQQTISDKALGLPVGDIYNPSTWTDSQRQAFEVGFASGGALAGVSSTGRALMPDTKGEKALKEQRAQEQAKQEAIAEQNKNIDEYINELDNPKRDYTNKYIADLENKQGQGVYIPKRSEKPVAEQGLGELSKQQPVTASDEVRDKIRNMPSLSNAQLVAEMQKTNDAVYSQALLSEAKKRGLNVGAGFSFVEKPANIVLRSETEDQHKAEQQRAQLADVQNVSDKLIAENNFIEAEQAKAIRQLEQQTGKPVNVEEVVKQDIPQKAINDDRIADVVEKAVQGDTKALQQFNNWSASVRLAMLSKYLNTGESTLSNAIANAQPKSVEQPAMLTPNGAKTFKASDRAKRFIEANSAFQNAPQTATVDAQQEQKAEPKEVIEEAKKEPVTQNTALANTFNPSFTLNDKQKGIEIKFGEKPDEEFRKQMKDAGFKWSMPKQLWWAKQNDKSMQFAESIGYKAEQKPAEQEIVKEEKPVEAKVKPAQKPIEEVVEKAGEPQNNEKAFRKVKQIAEELKKYYSSYVDTRFKRASKETKEETKDMLTTAIDTWATWQETALDKNNPEASEYARRAKEWLDHIRRAFEDVYGRPEIAMDDRVLDTMRSYVDSVKDYFADKTATVEKPKAEEPKQATAKTFKDEPEKLLNDDKIKKLTTSEARVISDIFNKDKKQEDVVKSKEEPKQTGSAEKGEIEDDETDIRGTSTRDNSKPVGERPDTDERNTRGSVQTPQRKRNVGDGTGERGVYGEIEEPEALTPAQKKNAKPSEVAGHNFTITDEDNIGDGGEKTKYRNNVEAIKLLKKLEAENRLATPSEQKVLAKYVGWGGLSSVFSYGRVDPKWEAEAKEIKELLTEQEYRDARSSTTSAFYTPIDVVKAIWGAVERIGFKGGRVLEPALGVGNFFGVMPEAMRSKSALNGVEIDSISGRIAKQLYQKANIDVTGYETTQYPDNFFDLVISNVPFKSNVKLHDPRYNKYKLDIHNYYFAKSIDKVRNGGLICFITATSTMQGSGDNARIRELLKTKADLVGAIRLPTGTFKGNAGTNVDADLIILQKREPNTEPSKFSQEWLNLVNGEAEGRYGVRNVKFNEYYENNAEMVIGEWKIGDGYYDMLVADGKGLDVAKELEARIELLPKNIYKPLTGKRNLNSIESAKATFLAPSDARVNAYIVKDGKAFQNIDGNMVELDSKEQKKAVDYVGLRDVVKKILSAQITPETTDAVLEDMRAELNKTYDSFVKKYGYVNDAKNVKSLSLDPEFGIVSSIENYKFDKKTKKAEAKKNDIFTKRTVNAVVEITSADNVSDALALSLANTGAVNIDYIAKLMGKKPAGAVESLEGLVYQNPATMGYETADEYLSGNVREKLEYAKQVARQNKDFEKNVKALEKVQPKDLTPEEITVALGTPWIPASDIEAFAKHMVGGGYYNPIEVKFVPALGNWTVTWANNWGADSAKSGVNSISKWGTYRRPFNDILDFALNQKSPIVYDTHPDGTKTVNQKETTLAQQKVREVQEEFKKWIWQDKERTERLVNFYNNNFNNWRLREYDGSHLTMQGYSAVEPPLKPHQKNAIWRIMQNMNTLIAHCVGAGKTWTMQASAMEMKRLGIAKKSMFVIPNHMLKQFENEFRRIYPNAKLLTVSSETLPDVVTKQTKLSKKEIEALEKEKGRKLTDKELQKATDDKNKRVRAERTAMRQRVLSQIATEDWDGIIISHNMFKRIPMSKEATKQFIQEQIDEMRSAIIELSSANDKSGKRLVKELEKKASAKEAELKEAINEEGKDIVIPFEQLGIDQIFVDEADLFKNLGFVTKMNRIAGLSTTNSQRSTDMFMKTQYITKMNGGRGVVFATGTPISNTMAEMFTMLRYLDMQGLKDKNMSFFDNWASNFAVHEPTVERSPDGNGYRQTEKFTSFMNMPELIKMFRKVADVKNQQELDLDIPKLKNGKPTVIEIETNDSLSNYIKNTIVERANKIKNRQVDPSVDNMLKLTGDLRKASLDMRLIDPTVPEAVAGGKIKAVADNIFAKWKESGDSLGAQLVFCDLSTPKGVDDKKVAKEGEVEETGEELYEAEESEKINVYSEIKKRLIKQGVPENQIAFIHDAKNKNQKEELFEKVRSGEVRVLIGSTEKMGAGTNIQDRLVALHHVDAPWRPRDIEQREGRILRQGNENEEVEIFNYVTKDSFDANMWEKLKNKATMINQAMSDNSANRIIEDADANVLNFAEVEALASGNPLMAERVMVNAELNKYETLHGNYIKQQAENQRKALQIPAVITQAEIVEKQAKADIKKRVDITGDNFNLLLGKRNIGKRADAKEALEATVRNYKNEVGGIVGQIGGFDLRLRYVKSGNTFTRNGKTYRANEDTVIAELVGNNVYGCEPTLASIEHAVMNNPDKTLDNAVRTQETLKKELKSLEAEIARPFEYEDKYQKLKQRSAEIDKELGIGNNAETVEELEDTTKFSPLDNPAYQRSLEEIYDDLNDIFEGAKVEELGNEEWRVTTPNGKRIIVKVADRIILNDKQSANMRKAHNLDSDYIAEASGYWRAIGENDVDGELVISRNSKKGTAYHEILHAVMDLALTAKEKQALINAMKEAKATGKDVEEVIAERYRKWVLARKKGQGTAFGKLFKKMQDFYYKLKKLFTGMENAHNIMRKIESGEVWNREAKPLYSKNLAPKFMVSEDKISKFISAVLRNPQEKLVLTLGKVSEAEAKAIKEATGFDVEGFNHVWLDEDVRHIQNNHGEGNEKQKNAIGLTQEDMREALKAIEAPDKIEKAPRKEPSIRFIKTMDDGTYTVVEVVRQKKKRLAIKTMWKNVTKNKETATTTPRVKYDPQYTSEADSGQTVSLRSNGYAFDDSVAQGQDEVKYSEAPTKNNINSIVISTEPSSLTQDIKEQGIKGWLKEKAKNFYRDWVDKNDALHSYDNAIEKATGRKLSDGEKIYNKAQMMNATATGMANALIEGDEQHIKSLSKRLGRELHNVTLKKILEFISNDKMNKLFPNYLKENGYKDWVDAFGHYLAFRRLREMKRLYGDEYKLPKGVTIQDIEKAIQNAPAPFKKASEMYYDLNDNMLIILEDAGIISKEVHKLLNDKYKEYCPLMRDFSDTAGADMFLQGLSNGGRGIANVSSTLKRISLEGSERGVINPLETTFKAVAVMANRAERNKVGQLAVSYANLQGMEDIIRHIPTPKGGNAVADPKNSIFTVMIDGKKEAYQVIPELYSPIVGYNVPTAGFVLGVARDTARMLRTGATISPSFVIRNFIRDTIFASISSQNGFIPIVDSVKGAYALLHDAEMRAEFEVAGVTAFNFYKNAETAYKSLVELNGGKEINFYNPIDVIKALAKYPEEFSAFVESATRMGEFKRAREAGKSIDEATRDARELTIDFSRSGVYGENVNLVVPFFNATIQGGDKLYRLFRDNPVGTAVNVAKYIVLPSMVLWAMNYDDEEYKELDPKIKMTHWIIGDVRIPKPQEAGIIFGSGIEAMLDLATGNDKKAMKHWAKQVVNGVSPNIIPTVILPLIEWQANYSFFRDGKLVGYREEKLPDELQYKDSTSELSKDLGKLTGLSPIKLDNTVRGYTGTMGMLLWQAYDIGSMDKAKLPEKKITELPLIRDFFVNEYNARRSVDDFYKLAEQADKQHAGYGVKGKPTAVVQGIRRAKQQISNINKDIRNISSSTLTPSEKRERIDKKREIMHRIAKQANDRYGKFYE